MRQAISLLLPRTIQGVGPTGFPFLGKVGCTLFFKLLGSQQDPVNKLSGGLNREGLLPPDLEGIPKSLC